MRSLIPLIWPLFGALLFIILVWKRSEGQSIRKAKLNTRILNYVT